MTAHRSDRRLLEYESDGDRQKPERTVAAIIVLIAVVLVLATALLLLITRYLFGAITPNLGP
jgi:hypothetical protein